MFTWPDNRSWKSLPQKPAFAAATARNRIAEAANVNELDSNGAHSQVSRLLTLIDASKAKTLVFPVLVLILLPKLVERFLS